MVSNIKGSVGEPGTTTKRSPSRRNDDDPSLSTGLEGHLKDDTRTDDEPLMDITTGTGGLEKVSFDVKLDHHQYSQDSSNDSPTESDVSIFHGSDAAKIANAHEQTMTLKYALRHYNRAFLWAVLMAAPILMEGYDSALVPNFFSTDAFKNIYGRDTRNGKEVPTKWQFGICASASTGQFIGLSISPFLVNRLGYCTCSIIGLVWAGCSAFICYTSQQTSHQLATFLIGEFCISIPWGLFESLCLPYVSDITPQRLRGPATSMINIFWLSGQLLSICALRLTSSLNKDEYKVKMPLLGQFVFLVPISCIALLAPESPIYLVRKKQENQALMILQRLSQDPELDENGALASIRALDEHEKSLSQDMGIVACFSKPNRRRSEIAIVVCMTLQLVGSPLLVYSAKLLQKSGQSHDKALLVTIGMYCLCLAATFSTVALIPRLGRRTLWLGGLAAEICCLVAVGTAAFFAKPTSPAPSWVAAGFIILFAGIFHFAIGPVAGAIIAETPSTRLKAATNSVARGISVMLAIANMFMVPKLMDDKPDGCGLGARAALV